MLKMIIADDELRVRRGLKNVLAWEEYGIEVIGEASNGQEALNICQELQPDIVLLDIRMPVIDGLQVASKLKMDNDKIHIVFISGVQDFNYAKTALDIDADGYILKPLKIDELEDMIRRVVNSINLENNSKDIMLKLRKQLEENIPILREKFLLNLISNVYIREEDIWEKFHYFGVPFSKSDSPLVSILQIDDYEKAIENYMEQNKQLLTFSVSNISEEIMLNHTAGVCFSTSENEFVLIFNSKAQVNEKHVEICDEINQSINRFLKVSNSIGIGSAVTSVLQLNSSYKAAKNALQHKFFTGDNSIINIKDISLSSDRFEYINLYEKQNELLVNLKLGNIDAVSKVINDIFIHFLSYKSIPVEYVQSLCVELICIIYRNLFEFDDNIENIITNRPALLDSLYKTASLYELKDYVLTVFNKIAAYFLNKYKQKNSKLIAKIREIIETRYMEDISIQEISKEIYLSSNYIGLIFKKETGESITDYLTTVRMEKAKQLLKTTDLKILEVAEMTGYENPQYFSTVFKKYVGVNPQQFR